MRHLQGIIVANARAAARELAHRAADGEINRPHAAILFDNILEDDGDLPVSVFCAAYDSARREA